MKEGPPINFKTAEPVAKGRETVPSSQATVEYIFKSAHTGALSSALKSKFGTALAESGVHRWFDKKEQMIEGQEAAGETIVFESPEDAAEQNKTKSTVVVVAGQFNTEYLNTARQLKSDNEAAAEHRQKHFIFPYRLYSARDIETIKSYQQDLEDIARKKLESSERPLVLLGFSFGGIIAKQVADTLSHEYSGRVGLVTWHTPLDPEVGFLTKAAHFDEIYKEIDFCAVHDKQYPVVVLGGTEDGIVPFGSSLSLKDVISLVKNSEDAEGEVHIKPKATPGANHGNPLNSQLSSLRVQAALESVGRSAKDFGGKENDVVL